MTWGIGRGISVGDTTQILFATLDLTINTVSFSSANASFSQNTVTLQTRADGQLKYALVDMTVDSIPANDADILVAVGGLGQSLDIPFHTKQTFVDHIVQVTNGELNVASGVGRRSPAVIGDSSYTHGDGISVGDTTQLLIHFDNVGSTPDFTEVIISSDHASFTDIPFTLPADTVADAVLNIRLDDSLVAPGDVVTATFDFDETVTDFVAADVSVSNSATKGTLEGSGDTYTMEITALTTDEGSVTVSVAADAVSPGNNADSATFRWTSATGYRVEVYDKNHKTQIGTDGTLSRTLEHAVSIRIEKDLNRPEKITFQVPRKGDDADAIDIGKVVRVISGTDVVASGEIVGPLDKTRPLITVNVLGKAILLSYSVLPWDFKLEGSTAEAQVRELLKNYRFFRQNTEDDLNDGTHDTTEVTSVAESTTETNYYVTLTKTGEDYETSGTYISQPILLTDDFLGDPTDIARLRYVALLGNDTDIEVEFRHSNNDTDDTPGDSDFSAWSTEYNTSSDSETQQQLGITGYSIIADFRWVQVRFTLTTSDVTITPALQAFEVVAEYPSEISAGSISLAGDALDETFSFKSHLSALQRIVAARNAEFRVTDDYELDIAERFGVTTPAVTYTVHDNCEVIRFQQQDRRLSTEIWSLQNTGQGLTQPFKTSASESATEAYGSRPWIYTPNATTETARTQEIADELALRDTPTNTVVIEETDTTESIEVGDLVSFEYTERSIDTTLRVIAITVADPRLGTPRQIELISDEGFFASQADAISRV